MVTERRGTGWIWVLVTGFVFCCFIFYWVLLVLTQSPNLAGVENNVVYFIQRSLDGSRLYTDPELVPYSIAQYTPVYYSLVSGTAGLLGIGPDDVKQLFILNRFISLLALLFTSVIVGVIARKIFSCSLKEVLILAAVVFIFMEISSFARPDSVSNALYFLSLLFFLSSLKATISSRSQAKLLVIAAGIAVLAVFSKQSELTLPVFCSLGLLLVKRYRAFTIYLVAFLVTMAAGFLIAGYSFGLDVFIKNVILGIDNGMDISSFFGYILPEMLGRNGWLWLTGMTILLALHSKEPSLIYKGLVFLIVLQFITSCFFSLKIGSSSNYFTNWWILVLLGLAAYRKHLGLILSSIEARLGLLFFCVILTFRLSSILLPARHYMSAGYRSNARLKYEKELKVAGYLKTQMTGKSQLVFNNLFSPNSYLNNFLFREAVIPQNDIVTLAMYGRSVFDYSQFKRQLAAGEITFIVQKSNEQRPGFLTIPMNGYMEVQNIGEYRIFRHP